MRFYSFIFGFYNVHPANGIVAIGSCSAAAEQHQFKLKHLFVKSSCKLVFFVTSAHNSHLFMVVDVLKFCCLRWKWGQTRNIVEAFCDWPQH